MKRERVYIGNSAYAPYVVVTVRHDDINTNDTGVDEDKWNRLVDQIDDVFVKVNYADDAYEVDNRDFNTTEITISVIGEVTEEELTKIEDGLLAIKSPVLLIQSTTIYTTT